MNSITLLNAIQYKDILKLSAMEINKEYAVVGAVRCDTCFGSQILLELANHKMYLPKRFSNINDDLLGSLNSGKLRIINEGPHGQSYKLIFKEIY
jgi:hypothetical protein